MSSDTEPSETILGVAGKINDAVRGIANGVTFGLADKAEAASEALVARALGAEGSSYQIQLQKQTERDEAGGSTYEAGVVAGSLAPAAKTLLAMRTVIGGGVQTAELAAKGMQALSARLEKAGINDADVSSLIARTQTFVEAHPAEIASLAYGASAAKGLGIAGVSDYVNLHGLYTSRVEAPHPLDTPAGPVADSKAPER